MAEGEPVADVKIVMNGDGFGYEIA
jgi:hypothetical protein